MRGRICFPFHVSASRYTIIAMKPIIAIVGRPNVGKSTLFNKILGRKKAIVADEPGVTRDLNYAEADELGRSFTIIDTGGFESKSEDVLMAEVKEQTRLAIEEADTIIFVMDGRTGPTSDDADLVTMLRRSGKPVLYAANKVDGERQKAALADFYALCGGVIYPVSAENGAGVNELLDEAVKTLPAHIEEAVDESRMRVAIVGRPNVGKSSLLNKLIGRQRSIVSNVAGTTRDSIDTPFEFEGDKYLFVDTAGIRRKNRVSLTVESYCVMEAIKTISKSDVVLLVVDAKAGLHAQDEKLAGLIEDRKRNCVIVVNKWDAMEDKETNSAKHVEENIRERMPFIAYAPVVFVSAMTGQRVANIFKVMNEVVESSKKRITTSKLNDALSEITLAHRAPAYREKLVKFYYATQTAVSPPEFVIFTNIVEGIDAAYARYLENALRFRLGFDSCPIRIHFRKRE